MDAFGTPTGVAGRIAGWLMGTFNQPLYRELLPLLDLRPGSRVLEVGYGPGRMIPMMLATQGVTVAGVDPSETMRDMATEHNRAAAERVDLRLGVAERTGYPNGGFDRVLAVNNAQGWPDLAAGVPEMRRVTASGGRFVVAVHSRRSKARGARHLGLRGERLAELDALLRTHFDNVEQYQLEYTEAFTADIRAG